jgi:uncharacterized YkwD family protein
MKKLLATVLLVALTLSVATTSALAADGNCGAAPPVGTPQNPSQILQIFLGGGGQNNADCSAQLNSLIAQLFAEYTGNSLPWFCGETPAAPGDEAPADDCPDGECPDGECPDGECPDGDCPDGDCPDGECPDGDCPDGDCPDGECPDGECPDGECPDGECPDGECPDDEGDAPDADSPPSPGGKDPDQGDSPSVPAPGDSGNPYREYQLRVIALVNQERAAAGLSPLAESSALNKVATAKSQDMADHNYFSHTSPTYGSPFEMLGQFGISYRSAGENIAMGQSTPEQVMDDWMNSSGHRANILNSSYTQIGVGIVRNAAGRYIWTQTFLRP